MTAMEPIPQILTKICTDGPMASLEVDMDWGNIDRYVSRCVKAENRAWGKALNFEFPDIDLASIEDEDTRRKVGSYWHFHKIDDFKR